MRALLLVCLTAPLACGADLTAKLDHIISQSPAVSRAFVGVQVVRLADEKVLYARNADRLFVPASNMKLFTAALALGRLGPDYRFKTQVLGEGTLDASGTLAGDLRLVGGGDPSLSGRDYPYQHRAGSTAAYSLRAVEELADQVVARGVKRIDGDIVGDDSRYVWEPHASGWASGNAMWEYGAPVSALILDDNSFAITLRPGSHAGELAEVRLTPALEYFAVDNRVITTDGGERKIHINRSLAGRELHVWGVIPKRDPGMTELLAVEDPAVYAAEALRDALERRGVAIHGGAVAQHRYPDDKSPEGATASATVFAERTSPPLLELLKVADKVSQNLHMEVFLRETSMQAGRTGGREDGLAEMAAFLDGLGISKESYQFTDGSGLSRSTLVSPAAIGKLLAAMYKTPDRERWLDLLPVGGQDGTLGSRFHGHAEAQAIRAKTGTLDHVKALSGYVESPSDGLLAFSILVNNFEEPAPEVTRLLDQLALALVQ